jgi:hypothetical protein
MLPQPGGYMTGSLDLPPVTKIGLDAAYVLCADDIALARPGAEFAAVTGRQLCFGEMTIEKTGHAVAPG